MIKPYTYYLYHTPTGKKYYGVRLAPKVEPEQDLWVQYFGSSDKVDALRKAYGNDSFQVEVRKVFEDVYAAHAWEQKVLKRIKAVSKSDWLNQAVYEGPFFRQGPHTEETKKRMRKPKSEETRNRMKRPKSEEHKRKIAKANTGKHHTEETKRKLSESHKGVSTWNKGVSLTDAHKEHLSIALKGRKTWNKGIPRTEEDKKKMRKPKRKTNERLLI
jgi:hypothetical protein